MRPSLTARTRDAECSDFGRRMFALTLEFGYSVPNTSVFESGIHERHRCMSSRRVWLLGLLTFRSVEPNDGVAPL